MRVSFLTLAIALAITTPARAQDMDTPSTCARTRAVDTTVYDTTQVHEQPLVRSMPGLTIRAGGGGLSDTGLVVLSFIIGTKGQVDKKSIEVMNTASKKLAARAKDDILQTLYWAACKDGAPVRVRLQVPMQFTRSR